MLTSVQEGQEGVFELKASADDEDISADDPEAVKLMIEFLYTHDYCAPPTQTAPKTNTISTCELSDETNIAMHAKMYALGEKYDLNSLKDAAQAKFKTAIETAWSGPSLARTARLVFSTTADEDDGLRAIVVKTIQSHRKDLQAKADVESTIMGIERLSYRLWKDATNPAESSEDPTCQCCFRKYHAKYCDVRPSGSVTSCKAIVVACDCRSGLRCAEHRTQ